MKKTSTRTAPHHVWISALCILVALLQAPLTSFANAFPHAGANFNDAWCGQIAPSPEAREAIATMVEALGGEEDETPPTHHCTHCLAGCAAALFIGPLSHGRTDIAQPQVFAFRDEQPALKRFHQIVAPPRAPPAN